MVISGRFIAVGLLGVVPLVLFPQWETFGACLFGLLGLVAIDLCSAASPKNIHVYREVPPSTRLNQPTPVSLILHNNQSRPVHGSVRDSWQPTARAEPIQQRLRIPRKERRRVSMTLTPNRRGTLRAQTVTFRCFGVLRLVARQATVPAVGSISVQPPFESRKQLPSRLARLREMDGNSAVQVRGAGHEFDSLRDYVRGDDVRSIDWRATARRQDLVVRTWRPERDRRVVIVVDSSRTSAVRVEQGTRFDTSIEAALLLAALASAGGDRVEFIVLDRQVRARASSTSRGSILHQISTAVTDVHPTLLAADWSQIPVEVSRVSRQRSLVVVLTALDSAALQEGLFPVLPQLCRQHQVLVGSVADPSLQAMAQQRDTLEQTFTAAAAERAVLDETHLYQMLNSFGSEVVRAEPQKLPAAIADTYLKLKASGRL